MKQELPLQYGATEFRLVTQTEWQYRAQPQHIRWLLAALEYSNRAEDNIFTIIEALESGEALGLEIWHDDVQLGLAVLDKSTEKDGDWLNVWTLAGEQMDGWLPALLEHLDDAVQLYDMAGVKCGGRPGWRKMLARYGWKEQAVIMGKARQ